MRPRATGASLAKFKTLFVLPARYLTRILGASSMHVYATSIHDDHDGRWRPYDFATARHSQLTTFMTIVGAPLCCMPMYSEWSERTGAAAFGLCWSQTGTSFHVLRCNMNELSERWAQVETKCNSEKISITTKAQCDNVPLLSDSILLTDKNITVMKTRALKKTWSFLSVYLYILYTYTYTDNMKRDSKGNQVRTK